jgi:NMD protein affecting ribosome stability and mRNA decay
MKVLFCDACGRSNNGIVSTNSDSLVRDCKMDELISGSGRVDLCSNCITKLTQIMKSCGWAPLGKHIP